MSDADAMWDQVYDAFKDHKIRPIDQSPQVNLNRIAAKYIGGSFDPSNCDIHEEVLTPDELRQLKRYSEDDAVPHRPDEEPIVVLVHNGQRFVIDGRRRVTKWLKEENPKSRLALIIEPKASAS
jgi:hypothetical protein